MARIRTIKPQHVSDKRLPEISLQAHLLWVLSWCFSDDEGIFENDPLLIKSTLFPRRTDVRVEQIEQWLGQLVNARYIIPFTYNGGGYYIHRTFKTHQKIDKPQPSKIPSPAIKQALESNSPNGSDHSDTGRELSPLYSRVEESSIILPKGRGNSEELPPEQNGEEIYDPGQNPTVEYVHGYIKKHKPPHYAPYFDLWNLFAEKNSLPKLRRGTPKRIRKLTARIREPDFDLSEVLKKAKGSEFIMSSNWFSFDWIIENNENYLKVMEGNYDNKNPVKSQSSELSAIAKTAKEAQLKQRLEDQKNHAQHST